MPLCHYVILHIFPLILCNTHRTLNVLLDWLIDWVLGISEGDNKVQPEVAVEWHCRRVWGDSWTCPLHMPAGVAGACQHVIACLFTMECKKANTGALPPPESCTSLQRAWGPHQRNISPQALQQVVVERAKMPRPRTVAEPDNEDHFLLRGISQQPSLAHCMRQGQAQH